MGQREKEGRKEERKEEREEERNCRIIMLIGSA